ncbi:MAG: tetratricopeptide repeat protein [Planctomycetota bacterium]
MNPSRLHHGLRWVALLVLGLSSTIGCAPTRPTGPDAARGASQSPVRVTADQRIKAGQVLKDAGQLDAALLEFNRALRDNPRSVDAVLGIGSVEHARSEYRDARDTYTRAVQLDGRRYDARYYLGLMQQVLGETGEAINQYRIALELNPDDPLAHRDLATAYLQVGRPNLALPHAEAAVRLAPVSQPAWCNLAATYSLLGRYNDALDSYRTATEIGELDVPVLLGLGDTHLKLSNYQRAVNTLAELVRRYPSAVAHERLGYALFRAYDFDSALRQYQRSLAYDADQPAALNGVGACLLTDYLQQTNLRRRQKLYDALDAWRRSLQLNPHQPQIVDLLARYDLPD